MSGLETNLKNTRLRPGHYETKTETETETLKISLETSITAVDRQKTHAKLQKY